jgi:hypothetical protein
MLPTSGLPMNFAGGVQKIQLRTEGIDNRDLMVVAPLVSGSIQFSNEWNLYSYLVVTDVFSTELGVQLSFVKPQNFESGGGVWTPLPLCTPLLPTYVTVHNFRILD